MSGVTSNQGTDGTIILGDIGLVPPSSISTQDPTPLVGCLLPWACSSALVLLQRWLEFWLTPPCLHSMGFAEWDFFGSRLLGRWRIYKNTSCGLAVSLVEITPLSSTLLVPASYGSDPESNSIILE